MIHRFKVWRHRHGHHLKAVERQYYTAERRPQAINVICWNCGLKWKEKP